MDRDKKFIKNLKSIFYNTKSGINELKRRIIFVIFSLIIFRFGSFIPIPGIDPNILERALQKQKGTIIELFNMFSGGALNHASIFALGIMPYISASIIIQLVTILNPKLAEIKKDGEIGKRRINQYTRYLTLFLSIIQSIAIATALPNMNGMHGLIINQDITFYLTAIISLVTGTTFLMWLGEQITERGIGNGISIIIFSGIVAGLTPAIANTLNQVKNGELNFIKLLLAFLLIFIITFFVVFVERGQRRIMVNYAKRQQGRRIYSSQYTHLPLKVNMAGVIPTIFASSFILLPATLSSWFSESLGWKWLNNIYLYLQPRHPIYILLYSCLIIFFCFFYTGLVFNPRETADNLKKSGAFLPGIRPGEQTARYIDKIISRLTLVGSLYITFICLIPEFMRNAIKVPFYFGGTSLLIVVVVIIEFIEQVQTFLMSSQYDLAIKKANLKNNI